MFDPADQFGLFAPPYRTILPSPDFPETLGPSVREVPGAALIWRLPRDGGNGAAEAVRRRRGGLALTVILPQSTRAFPRRRLLAIVAGCRPHTVLPHQDELDPRELRCAISRPPSNLSGEVTDYLAWRGIRPDDETLRLVRRTLDLSADLRTVSGLARGLYTSRRALGRRFMDRGLPVPSHWLHFGRLLRAAIRLQTTEETLFTVACRLGYPDGFALSNQMYRLTGVRPSQARDCLGWEWILESWLRLEAEVGGLSTRAFQPGAAETFAVSAPRSSRSSGTRPRTPGSIEARPTRKGTRARGAATASGSNP